MAAACDFFGGYLAGVVGYAIGHPFDTIKVTQQLQVQGNGNGILQVSKRIYYNQGAKGFFRGLTFPLAFNGVMNSAFFGTYAVCFAKLEHLRKLSDDSRLEYGPRAGIDTHHDKDKRDSFQEKLQNHYSLHHRAFDAFIAGAVAGGLNISLVAPVEIVKVKLQNESRLPLNKVRFDGPMKCISHIIKVQGLKGLYQGITPLAFREIISAGFYTSTYFTLKHKLHTESKSRYTLSLFLAGGIAGVVSLWLVLPFDVLTARMQADNSETSLRKYKSTRECARIIFEEQSYRGFIRGFWSSMFREFFIHGTIFITYEFFKDTCRL